MNSLAVFLMYQIKEIEVYKWIESEKVGYDLGAKAEVEWVILYAETFRTDWELKYGKINC